ncbi:MAG: ATPase [Hyphomicrobiales bacterium]|nr:MAG: ATPase [Hyphomicrobiales bacterium]
MERFVAISGCSGGGKSTLLGELGRRGFSTVEEPGRRIVAEELAGDGAALPWRDAKAFVERAMAMAHEDLERAEGMPGFVFFDRGLLDAASAFCAMTGESWPGKHADEWRFNRLVFLAPPWPEIYRQDEERRHGFDAAIAEYERLLRDYPLAGYEVVELSRMPVGERADFVLDRLG